MAEHHKLTVFISSTCYDLQQIRVDLEDFISSLGYHCHRSDAVGFPVDPHKDCVENCLETVRNNTDILVLVVGGRYGSVSSSGKSVTNQEYLAAVSCGIPVYAFVQEDIINTIKLWENNPDGDFSSHVDSTELFEFVQMLYKDTQWVSPFRTAQDITGTLREKWATLFSKSARFYRKAHMNPYQSELASLTGESLKIAVEQPTAWPLRLLGCELSKRLQEHSSLRRNIEMDVCFDTPLQMKIGEFVKFSQEKIEQLARCPAEIVRVINKVLNSAMGNNEKREVSVKDIVDGAKQITDAYRQTLQWVARVRASAPPELCRGMVAPLSKFALGMAKDIEAFPDIISENLSHLKTPSDSDEPLTLHIEFVLSDPGAGDEFEKECDEALRKVEAYVEDFERQMEDYEFFGGLT